jgi:hypothetical protein
MPVGGVGGSSNSSGAGAVEGLLDIWCRERHTAPIPPGVPRMAPTPPATRFGRARCQSPGMPASRPGLVSAFRVRTRRDELPLRDLRRVEARPPIATARGEGSASAGALPPPASGTTRPKRFPGYPRSTSPRPRRPVATACPPGRWVGRRRLRRRGRASTTSHLRGSPRRSPPQAVGVLSSPAITRETLR